MAIARLARRAPRSLTSRLVVTAVALVALVSVLVVLLSTAVMHAYLTSQKDEQLTRASNGAERFDGRGPGSGSGSGGPGGEDGEGGGTGGNGGNGGGPPTGFDSLRYNLDSASVQNGVLGDDGEFTPLSTSAIRELQDLTVGAAPRTVSLDGIGDYRVRAVESPDGDRLAIGLPMRDVDDATRSLLLWSSLLALTGVALAGGVGTVLVRRQLRPLRAVATTAYEVTAMPLQSGEVDISTRVPAPYTDEGTEVGQVGSALNTLLDHVDASLAERHRSEQQVRQFVADASHELRTPLATIHGYAELSRRTPDDPEALGTAMAKVETEASRMSSLVGDMLLLARLDSGRPLERAEVDLTMLLLETVTDARVVAPDHEWRLDLPDEPITVTGDEQRLHQVVTNLTNNARRHTPPGTTVTVAARGAGPSTRNGSSGGAVVTVHDDGPGLSPDLVEHAFERFTRGDSSRTRASGGAGLGLSLVQAIVAAHGGTASVESRPGSTTFTLRLP